MKVGDLVKFKKSGVLATIIDISSDFGSYAHIMVHGDVLDNTACDDGFTYMNLRDLCNLVEKLS